MKKFQLLFLLISIFVISTNAQKTETEKIAEKKDPRQKKDNWQEYKYPDFNVKFPDKPKMTEKFYQLANESFRYSAIDAKGIEYSVDNLRFSKEILGSLEDYDTRKTIYNNLELQWTEGFGAELVFRSEIYQQGVNGRNQFFQYKDKSGNIFDVMQKAFKKDAQVYVVRTVIPLPLMVKINQGLKDFPPIVNKYFDSFRFKFAEEKNEFPPPFPPSPGKPTKILN